jgi:hypothetical protein
MRDIEISKYEIIGILAITLLFTLSTILSAVELSPITLLVNFLCILYTVSALWGILRLLYRKDI